MFSLTKLLLLILVGVTAVYWWQSGIYKGRARELATAHCRQLGLQLLDQSMVITDNLAGAQRQWQNRVSQKLPVRVFLDRGPALPGAIGDAGYTPEINRTGDL